MESPRPPPELIDDAVREILLRIPPDEPAHLVRASLVCKLWMRVLSDRAFRRRYRRFHRAPPLLGFFHDFDDIIRFVPSTEAASPFRQLALDWASWAYDCRHGRVLLQHKDSNGFIVWDPITGAREDVPDPGVPSDIHDNLSCNTFCAAVLCARAGSGCDHLHCGGGPFHIVFVGSDYCLGDTWAYIYSSETGAWSAHVPTRVCHYDYVEPEQCAALVGDELYFMISVATTILKYRLGEHRLSVIEGLTGAYDLKGCVLLGREESGSLWLASIKDGSSLCIWSKKVKPEGVDEGWVQIRLIQLETKLAVPIDNSSYLPRVIGFVEGVGDVIIRTKDGILVLDLKSERVRKVLDGVSSGAFLPFTSFYTLQQEI